MAKNDSDTDKHDALGQEQDENVAMEEQLEEVVGSSEVQAAELSAMNTDNDTAREANDDTLVSDEELVEEAEVAVLDAEIVAEEGERKHKNRESTSEKAKKAAANPKPAKATLSQQAAQKLDPLRLRGKKYRAIASLVEKNKTYSLEEALELVKKVSITSFDGAVEMHVKVKGEAIRGTVSLPAGSGKTKKVAIATDEVIEAIANGKIDFDVLLSSPAQMPKLAKYAKLLGPKGLMPSPKAGTVTDDLEKAQEEIGGGRVEYRADKAGIVHLSIGRISFPIEKLVENYRAVEAILLSAKIVSISVSPTMGPGVKVALTN